MTTSVQFLPHPGSDLVTATAPMLRAYQTVAAYQDEHGEIGLTKSGTWNRHCIDWVVRRMDFPNWTAEKLYRVNKVLDEYDVPPLEYLRVLLTSLRLGRKMGGGWRLTKPGMALAGDPEAAYSKIAPAFLFRFDHTEGMRVGDAADQKLNAAPCRRCPCFRWTCLPSGERDCDIDDLSTGRSNSRVHRPYRRL